MHIYSLFLCALMATGLALNPVAATASVPSDLDTLPLRPVCKKMYLGIEKLVAARDQGMSKAAFQERNRTGSADDAVSEKLIDDAFAYALLTKPALTAYALWTCHASSYGLDFLPLATVHLELGKCAAPPSGDACLRAVRDQVLRISRHSAAERPLATQDMPKTQMIQVSTAPNESSREPISGSCAKPVYPRESLINREAGTVTVRLLIDANGAVLLGKVSQSSGFDRLDQEALTARSRCTYAPLMRDGKPESGFITTSSTFSLNKTK